MALSDQQMTADQLLTLPGDGSRQELVGGWVVSEPPASFRHGDIAAELFFRLTSYTRRNDLGRVVSTETGFLLARGPDTVRAPDVAFVSHRSLERAGRFRGFFPGPPDLAVEILSPSERPVDVHAKVGDYLEAGARLVWVVDPARRQVMVHRDILRPVALLEEAMLSGEEVLPGFEVKVSDLFG